MIDLDEIAIKNDQYLIIMDIKIKEPRWLWHHRLGHTNMNIISKLFA